MKRHRFTCEADAPVCFLGSHPRDTRSLLVLGCGYDKCSPEYRVERRNHPLFVLEYVLRGEGTFRAGDICCRLHGGMVFYYGPGKAHAYWTHAANPMEKVWIAYSGTDAARLTSAISGHICGAHGLESPEQAFTLIDAICTEVLNKSNNAQIICDSLLMALLALIAQLRQHDASGASAALQVFLQCKNHIDTHIDSIRSPFELCHRFDISPSYLCRLFKRFASRSPAAYLNGLKLNHAAYLLLSSPLSIKQIANELRFGDQYSFSRAFKRHFGVSPSSYRLSTDASA